MAYKGVGPEKDKAIVCRQRREQGCSPENTRELGPVATGCRPMPSQRNVKIRSPRWALKEARERGQHRKSVMLSCSSTPCWPCLICFPRATLLGQLPCSHAPSTLPHSCTHCWDQAHRPIDKLKGTRLPVFLSLLLIPGLPACTPGLPLFRVLFASCVAKGLQPSLLPGTPSQARNGCRQQQKATTDTQAVRGKAPLS